MMFDWGGYRQQLMETIGEIVRLSPETVRGYTTLSAVGTKTNHLNAKTRELKALAVAVSLRCDGVNAGAALVFSARVTDAYEANKRSVAAATGANHHGVRSQEKEPVCSGKY